MLDIKSHFFFYHLKKTKVVKVGSEGYVGISFLILLFHFVKILLIFQYIFYFFYFHVTSNTNVSKAPFRQEKMLQVEVGDKIFSLLPHNKSYFSHWKITGAGSPTGLVLFLMLVLFIGNYSAVM